MVNLNKIPPQIVDLWDLNTDESVLEWRGPLSELKANNPGLELPDRLENGQHIRLGGGAAPHLLLTTAPTE